MVSLHETTLDKLEIVEQTVKHSLVRDDSGSRGNTYLNKCEQPVFL